MFKELLPILETQRGLIITLAPYEKGNIRVTVTPKPKSKDEETKLIRPFMIEDTPEALDAGFSEALTKYTQEHLSLAKAVAEIEEDSKKALAEIKAAKDKEIADAKAKAKPSIKSSTPAKKEEKPAPAKPAAPPSLFDGPAELSDTPAPKTTETPAPEITNKSDDDDDGDDEPSGGGSDTDVTEDESEGTADGKGQVETNVEPAVDATTASKVVSIKAPSMFDEEEEILKESYVTDDIAAAA